MALFLFVLWVVLNGGFRWDVVLTGIPASLCILLFACRFLEWSLKREAAVYRGIPEVTAFICLLVEEIVKANISVIRLIFGGKTEPVVCSFETPLHTRLGRVMLANAITLTPGTITIRCEENRLTVHCLDKSLAKGLEGSELEKKIQRLEDKLRG